MAVKKIKKRVWVSSLGVEYDTVEECYKAEAVHSINIFLEASFGDRALGALEVAKFIIDNRTDIEGFLKLLDKKD